MSFHVTLAGSSLALHPGAVPRVEVAQLESVRYDANIQVQAQRRIQCVRRSSTHASFTRRRMGAFVVLVRAVLQPVEVARAVLVFHGSVALHWTRDLQPDSCQHADARCVWLRQRNPLKRSDSFTLFKARHSSCVGEFGSAAYSLLQRK